MIAAETPGFTRVRKWSPSEAWESGKDALAKLPAWGIVDFMGMGAMKRVTVRKNNLIEFEDQNLGPDKHRFFGGVATPDGGSLMLSPEREYGIFPTPCDLCKVVVVDPASGATLGVAPAWEKVSPLDTVSVQTMQEAQGRVRAAMSAPVVARHADEAQDRLAAMAHNEALIQESRSLGVQEFRSKKNLPGKAAGMDLLPEPASTQRKRTVEDEWQRFDP